MIRREEIIGDCRLILGDCLKVLPEIGRVDHVFIDPPYEAIMHAAKSGASRRIRTDGRVEIKSLDFAAVDEIRDDVARQIATICDGWSLIFCAPEGVGRWADAINATAAKYKRACVWIKPDSTPQLNGQGPAMGAENFIVSWCGRGYARWNAGGKRGVYTHLTNPPDRHGGHPTEKPWRLFAELLTDFTRRGDLVCDAFMGSGTTGVACVKLGRRFVGIEREPKYFDIACERIRKAYAQPDMFIERPAEPKQEQLFGAA
ncbi:site-specific DNA-methyltransferase [Mesorhizobium sp. M2D.F.Ca.ET.185.01.1.1]|uniref:DNA-methyltransferase n=1 Tax=unclassified Mesorhizobium TaxID=325217 RepID=UPI000FCCDB16|nr:MULTISPECIES: DNA methyltransferase [unclassified Mesorhizobium]TGT96031.1 site-specific DNA-methyltransferase [bacterium M00.F.Ca.ET.163.01.1.1]TGV79191.1 site-specific DNA-methyltransferase [Mesorhizobium sp. M00.F.Ca.ET.149.01.1.1]TGP25920.1 site-specific DNA-methyltransferase [Mesorhizobium sp. M2D.F.Ca.ET.232.01.1.1]TGQ23891.1 site-specific DNA-methyltransferase [Mesorhizobium sp. M00.F.Ca.ET.220.01.1.1]TGQ89439.1 site-specific DNA-methyltransferase [Mesorhizobium sp. M2D.F.Ca.ET.206.0